MMGWEQSIEEIDQDSFVGFGAEDPLEAEIGEETDIFVLEIVSHDWVGCGEIFLIVRASQDDRSFSSPPQTSNQLATINQWINIGIQMHRLCK